MGADIILDGAENLFGALDPRAGRGAHVQLDQPGIHGREEVGADEQAQHAGQATTASATAGVRIRRRRMTVSSQP